MLRARIILTSLLLFMFSKIVLHPNYEFTPQADRYDIALLKEEYLLKYNFLQPVLRIEIKSGRIIFWPQDPHCLLYLANLFKKNL